MATESSTEQVRAALRREHDVRLVTPEEEGFAAATLPGGVYGFTSSPVLASPLFRTRQRRNFEVHHLPNGVTSVVGFVTPAEAGQLMRHAFDEPVTVSLHPDVEGEATAIVSIPYDRVVQHRQYSIRNAGAINLVVVTGTHSVTG